MSLGQALDDIKPTFTVKSSHRAYKPIGGAMELFLAREPEVLLAGAAGTGKAQPLDAIVQTPSGPQRMGDIGVGDVVLGGDGAPTKVVAIPFRGPAPTVEVEFSDGTKVECSDGHLWRVGWFSDWFGVERVEVIFAKVVRILLSIGATDIWVDGCGQKFDQRLRIVAIRDVGIKECQCITVENADGLYLTENFIVTHNSRAALEKLFACATKYPGSRHLIVRQTRASLTQTGLVTWETKVVPTNHECLRTGGGRKMRQSYNFRNGSEIVLGGLSSVEDIEKVMSTEYDLIYVQEATDTRLNDWEQLTTRLRNGKMPYQQLIADCNPGSPKHWLKAREAEKKTRHITSRHEDNPVIWDREKNCPTEAGAKYLAVLDALTGHRKPRLRHGLWTQAEGVIYDEWDDAVHLVDPVKIRPEFRFIWVIDWGYNNPFVWQCWMIDNDDRAFLVREIYRVKKIVDDHVARIKYLTKDMPAPSIILADHDAEDRATFERKMGRTTVAADKAVTAGIQEVQERLRKSKDGKPRLFICRDCTDPEIHNTELRDSGKPTSTAGEFPGYVWDTGAGKRVGEVPLKQDDHGMDCVRYLCKHLATKSTKFFFDTDGKG